MSTRPLIFIDLSSLCITDIPANFLTSAREIISKLCYLTRSSSAGTSWQSGQDLLDNFNVRFTHQYHLSVFHQFSKCELKCKSKMEDGWIPHSAKLKKQCATLKNGTRESPGYWLGFELIVIKLGTAENLFNFYILFYCNFL